LQLPEKAPSPPFPIQKKFNHERLITKLKDWQPLSLPVFWFILIFNKTKPY